ncbi:MAG: YigZ family protein [Cellulosilyticaceae bacterium]
MSERLITIEKNATSEMVEKKSRFITYVFKIESQEEANEHLANIKKQYWDARHHCYAYQLGEKNEIQRFSDDGEPQGTAGKPILDVLKGRAITNTLIIVIRYFGGTLLGTGGLVRAYGHSAKAGVEAAGLVEKIYVSIYAIEMTYTLLGKVQYLLNEEGYVIRETLYTDVVTVLVEVEDSKTDAFETWMIEKTNAEVSIQKGEKEMITAKLS